MVILSVLALISLVATVATIRTLYLDGYRQTPTDPNASQATPNSNGANPGRTTHATVFMAGILLGAVFLPLVAVWIRA